MERRSLPPSIVTWLSMPGFPRQSEWCYFDDLLAFSGPVGHCYGLVTHPLCVLLNSEVHSIIIYTLKLKTNVQEKHGWCITVMLCMNEQSIQFKGQAFSSISRDY